MDETGAGLIELVLGLLSQCIGDTLVDNDLLVLQDHLLIAGRPQSEPGQHQAGKQNGGEKNPGGAAHQIGTLRSQVIPVTLFILCPGRSSGQELIKELWRAISMMRFPHFLRWR